MTAPAHPVFVTGFLGAGKSTLAARIGEDRGLETVEVPGLQTAGAIAQDLQPRAVVTVIDAANVAAHLADPLIAPLILAQISEADLLAVSRTDVVEAGPVMDLVLPLTEVPIIEVPNGNLPHGEGFARQSRQLATCDLVDRFICWHYEGAAALTMAEAEALLADRPTGTYRVCGIVNTGEAALELQLAGRVRQTTPRPATAETQLAAWGAKGHFTARAMDTVFSEKVAASVSMGSLFSYR